MINMKEGVTPQRCSPKNNLQKKKEKRKITLTLRLTQSNQWVGVDHAARIHSLNSPHSLLE